MKNLEHQCLDFWRSKPADEVYDAGNYQACALAQFTRSIGGDPLAIDWRDRTGTTHRFPPVLLDAAFRVDGRPAAWTFGQAADRLEKLLQP